MIGKSLSSIWRCNSARLSPSLRLSAPKLRSLVSLFLPVTLLVSSVPSSPTLPTLSSPKWTGMYLPSCMHTYDSFASLMSIHMIFYRTLLNTAATREPEQWPSSRTSASVACGLDLCRVLWWLVPSPDCNGSSTTGSRLPEAFRLPAASRAKASSPCFFVFSFFLSSYTVYFLSPHFCLHFGEICSQF